MGCRSLRGCYFDLVNDKRQSTEVTLLVPGKGYRRCGITFTVMPTCSTKLYQQETVTLDGETLDARHIEGLNPGLDQKIALARHKEYAIENQGFDPSKPKRKCKKKIKSPDHPSLPL